MLLSYSCSQSPPHLKHDSCPCGQSIFLTWLSGGVKSHKEKNLYFWYFHVQTCLLPFSGLVRSANPEKIRKREPGGSSSMAQLSFSPIGIFFTIQYFTQLYEKKQKFFFAAWNIRFFPQLARSGPPLE